MEVGDLARGMLLGQALGTMMMTEAEITGAIHGGDAISLEAEIVEGFHADEPLGVLAEQLGEGGAADMSDKMVEGFGDREGFLVGVRQVVQVVEDGAFEVAQVVVSRTTAAQAQPEEEQSPPAEKATVVIDHGLEASIGQLVQPVGKFGEEVADSFEEGPGQGYDLPCLRRLALTWVWIRARESWVSWRTSCLMRRCSWVHSLT